MDAKSRGNLILLKGLCMVVPSAMLVAAHWFPWRKMRGRDLHPLEAYSIGTAAIVGTASTAIALSDDNKGHHVAMLGIATASAGITTIAAHVVDALIKSSGKIETLNARIGGLMAQIEALKNHGDDI